MFAYAEIHYRPRFMSSLIYMKKPEIVCDTPTRIDSGRPLPLFIMIKDADRYPVQLETVVVHTIYEDGVERVARFPYYGLSVSSPMWWDSINIVPEFAGIVKVIPYVFVKKEGKVIPVCVDNYPGSSHSPLIINVSKSPLPGGDGWFHGDIHCHSYYTSDQIEFGAPLEVLALAGCSMGLHWIAVTDHSYDLDDFEDDYFSVDPLVIKWHNMRHMANLLENSFTIIPGEEVTCRTENGRNCHMLALNTTRFIKGSGDSGENGLNTVTERSIGEAVALCLKWGGIPCAAHPMERITLLEKLLLKRSEWYPSDLKTPGILALQIHNGARDRGFYKGKKTWINMILNGYRMYAFGGSDAHGDLNLHRSVGLPFFSVKEGLHHTFGSVKTIVRAKSKEKEDILEGLKAGRAVVTEGPFIDLTVTSGYSVVGPGEIAPRGSLTVRT
ncbi:MAG TPA: CehA/McbA family metallohydrolase, partial [Anaerolineae bacterium]|nr:CehA/McbA family metallohydrolase [Anaerolineae bacterium]